MKKMKLLCGLLAVVLVVALAGCGAKTPTAEPGDSVLGCLEALKAMDFDAMAQYVSESEDIQSLKDEISSEDAELVKLLLKRVSFEVVGTEKASDGKSADVTVKITNVDMNAVMTSVEEDLMAWALEVIADPAAEQPDEDAIMAKTIELVDAAISAEDAPMVSSDAVLPVAMENDKWIVTDLPDDAVTALLGNMSY